MILQYPHPDDDGGSKQITKHRIMVTVRPVDRAIVVSYHYYKPAPQCLSIAGAVPIYRMIQSSVTILKENVGEITWNRKCKYFFYIYVTVSERQSFYIHVALYCVLRVRGSTDR